LQNEILLHCSRILSPFGDWILGSKHFTGFVYERRSVFQEQFLLHGSGLEHLDRTRELLRRLGQWDVRLPPPMFLEGAVWKSFQLNLYDATYPLEQPQGRKAPRMITKAPTH
jgi:hypothetical protein